MKIAVSKDGSVVTAYMDGEIDHHYAEKVRSKLDSAIGNVRTKTLVLDMGGVAFMDSSGLGMVLGRYKKLSAKGAKLEIRNASKRVDRILRMSGVYALLERADGGKKNG